ncbi:uncharacterized protein LAESUDRAFT_763348 [Laetiporus sulphureus 93-53]|uniref:Uncharacterized protein n=1 Tax=Laetiporus sulphureus 93-53 TaxID=1314785 RepID=A0A165BZ48_9APHY|nr:uncharacterized protein LAESUDRAFT_763348 [Laetiporus sulphureus 93-53]KZT01913.1 hypothetical protein LAESUDRAFT_763348 [Laetiporus sulphureus 93-53]
MAHLVRRSLMLSPLSGTEEVILENAVPQAELSVEDHPINSRKITLISRLPAFVKWMRSRAAFRRAEYLTAPLARNVDALFLHELPATSRLLALVFSNTTSKRWSCCLKHIPNQRQPASNSTHILYWTHV